MQAWSRLLKSDKHLQFKEQECGETPVEPCTPSGQAERQGEPAAILAPMLMLTHLSPVNGRRDAAVARISTVAPSMKGSAGHGTSILCALPSWQHVDRTGCQFGTVIQVAPRAGSALS